MENISHQQIAQQAYELFEAAGFPEGRSWEFWLAAEQALREVDLADRYVFGGVDPASRAKAPDYLEREHSAGGDKPPAGAEETGEGSNGSKASRSSERHASEL